VSHFVSVRLIRYPLARSGHPRFVFGHSSFGFVTAGPGVKIFLRRHRSSVAPVRGPTVTALARLLSFDFYFSAYK
jgi:hypothetical protein